MDSEIKVKAMFKQATIKAGIATLQFEVLPSENRFMDVLGLAGSNVVLGLAGVQGEPPLDDAMPGGDYRFNPETGEVEEVGDER